MATVSKTVTTVLRVRLSSPPLKTNNIHLQPFQNLLMTWLDIERQRSCKSFYAGANPVVSSFNIALPKSLVPESRKVRLQDAPVGDRPVKHLFQVAVRLMQRSSRRPQPGQKTTSEGSRILACRTGLLHRVCPQGTGGFESHTFR